MPAIDGDDMWDAGYRADPKRYSRAALIGVIAAREAWLDAGLRIGEPNAGVVIGSGGGGIDVGERQYHDFFVERGRKVTPYAIPVSIVGMVSSEISISLRLRGVSHVLSCGCTSSTDAIGYAAALIRSGDADVVLSGGTDACVTPGMIFGFSRMKVVSTALQRSARPTRRGRSIEAATGSCSAKARGCSCSSARIARARAARRSTRRSTATDRPATPITACRWRRTARRSCARMSLAIERSGRRREEIGYVNYHGTSTVLERRGRVALRPPGVRRPCRPARRIVGEVDDRASAGRQRRRRRRHRGARAVARASCRRRSTSHDPDPACDLDFIPNHGRAADVEAALCNCLASARRTARW